MTTARNYNQAEHNKYTQNIVAKQKYKKRREQEAQAKEK